MIGRATTERDIWTGLFEREKRRLVAEGVPSDQADEQASANVRREIRGSR